MTVTIIGFTFFSLVVALLTGLSYEHKGRIIGTLITNLIVMGIVNFVLIYFLMPPFSHWLADGWPLMFFLNLFIPAGLSFSIGFVDDNASNDARAGAIGLGFGAILLVVYFVIALFTPPVVCNDTDVKQWSNTLKLENATTAYPETDLSNIIRVPEKLALSNAGNALTSGSNAVYGSYLAPNRAYLQIIQGHAYWAVDLRVTDWVAYRQQGSFIPGYLLVDAIDPGAPVQFRLGYHMEYVPTAGWNLDLDRKVYDEFLIGNQFHIDDLDAVEVTEDGHPYYVGTLLKHAIGFRGMDIAGLYQFDPETSVGQQLSLEEKPTWLDRVYSEDFVAGYIKLWGLFHNHTVCSWSQLGQEQIDDKSDVVTPNGLEYQFTTTSLGADPSLVHLITFDPTTGQGLIYPMSGKTLEGIKAMVETRSSKLNPNGGFIADICQLHEILGADTAYCVLLSKTTSSDNADHYGLGGYAFVDVEAAINSQQNVVAIAETFDEAYRQYQEIRARVTGNTDLASSETDVQIIGKVLSNTWVSINGGSFVLSVQDADGAVHWMLASGDSLNAAAAQAGTTVTVTCYQETNVNYLTVRYIVVEGVPDLDAKK